MLSSTPSRNVALFDMARGAKSLDDGALPSADDWIHASALLQDVLYSYAVDL